ncbi:MAG: hypothetical protein IPN03_10710 [Holophagales bacterium]|nr:hypothetical protein [Holophagales bacterium]MBK9374173.1 hypothetical protein [Holophagales bacterium]
MSADPRSPRRANLVLVEEPAATCTSCPVCGSEECLMLEELGTYCRTMTAASLATRKEEAEKKH